MKRYWHTDIAEHILMRHPVLLPHQDVAKPNDGTFLLLPPVVHHFRYLFLARNKTGPAFSFGCGVQPLYAAEDTFFQGYYDDLPEPATGHLGGFYLDNPDVIDVIDRTTPVGLTTLNAVTTPGNFATFFETHERLARPVNVWA